MRTLAGGLHEYTYPNPNFTYLSFTEVKKSGNLRRILITTEDESLNATSAVNLSLSISMLLFMLSLLLFVAIMSLSLSVDSFFVKRVKTNKDGEAGQDKICMVLISRKREKEREREYQH